MVRWFLQPQLAPYSFMQLVYSCKRIWAGWNREIVLIPRAANGVADNPAKRANFLGDDLCSSVRVMVFSGKEAVVEGFRF
ncbi:hypothetical protein V6N12_070246 [Hibiscus sabdariffa]|uniref:Uncharacterized protein n=1 Tax=Hibiscus sabdariffa TaxID=183260 RepID=A0ABR2FGE1_9ROSI